MVQDVKVILNRHPRCVQVSKRTDNVAILHVPRRVVVGTHHENAGMTAVRYLNQIVQVQEIVVVSGQQHSPVIGTGRQVTSIRGAMQAEVGG